MNRQAWELIGAIVLLLILRGIFTAGKAALKDIFKDAIFIMVWRFISGQHMHGEKKTDAGFWTHGTDTKRHQFERGGFMDRWEHKPQGHRILWRFGVLIALAGLGYGLLMDREITLHALEALGVYVVLVTAFVIEKKIRLRVHTRALLNPIAKSLAKPLNMSWHAVRKMIHIDPENITDEGDIGWFGPLPDQITPGEDLQKTIARVHDVHLPVDSEMEWKLDQQPRIAILQASQKPPDTVLWKDMLAEMAKCRPGQVVIGKDKAKQPYFGELTDLEDPHWGFDCNTKYGKSNFLGITIAQILHQDHFAQAIILDPKRSSLIDFVGSPDDPERPLLAGVTLANNPRDPEAMWAAIQKARAIFERRAEKHARDRRRKFPCVLVVIDELNQFAEIMNDWWRDQKAEDKRRDKDMRIGLEGAWPGWSDVMAILRMGRFVNMHIIVCSQDFRDDAFGGKGGRNYLGFKGMAGFNPSQWDKFMQTKPTPVMQNHPGRWIFSDGSADGDSWVQVVFANSEHDRSAYDYAAAERHLFRDADGEDVTLSDDEQAALPSVPEELGLDYYLSSIGRETDGQQPPATDGEEPRRMICGIREGAKFLGHTHSAFSKARQRASEDDGPGIPGEFKRGRTPCWYEDDLLAWEAARPRSNVELKLVRNDS